MKYNIGDLVWVMERKYIRQGRFDPAQMYKRRIDLVHENSMPYEPGN